MESFSNDIMTCRELENGLWNDYLGENIDCSKGHILAYHWKAEKQFSCLIKVKYSRAKISTIFSYILIVLSLGILGSLIVFLSQIVFNNCIVGFAAADVIIIILLFLLGICIGNRKK